MLDPNTAPLGFGGLVLAVERGIALWRGVRHQRVERMTKQDVEEIVRDALSLQAERMENAFGHALGETRRELIDQIWRAQ